MTGETSATPGELAQLRELLARQAIYDTLVRICRGADRFDRELFVGGFHPDALIEAGGHVADPGDVYDRRRARKPGQASTLHLLANHACELAGDTAHAETCYLYTGLDHDGAAWAAAGRYIDRLERRDGAWKIAFRLIAVEWSGALLEKAIPMFANPAEAVNGAPSRDRNDPSYRRPFVNLREPKP
jgi:hypothetical protein